MPTQIVPGQTLGEKMDWKGPAPESAILLQLPRLSSLLDRHETALYELADRLVPVLTDRGPMPSAPEPSEKPKSPKSPVSGTLAEIEMAATKNYELTCEILRRLDL